MAAVDQILKHKARAIDLHIFIKLYDQYEHQLEQQSLHRSFRAISARVMQLALE
ncbi:hypothetical protein MSKU9_1149 [Komagataeibacter diospyri]|uniref:Uncharacterized protein n=1 Tax=Komagataeibacter diospyri TaxID=1932662 RepID=A0A4P5NN53_9PROT|nr:hypothetical protein MSKU9_1149 [Komagataeibacter diospyri]